MMNEWDDRPPAEPAPWDIAALSGDLRAARDDWRARHRPDHRAGDNGFPSRRRLETVLFDLCGALFPQRLGPHPVPSEDEQCFVSATLDRALRGLQTEIALELGSAAPEAGTADATRIVADFARDLPAIRRRLDRDVEAAYAGDPAARSVDEVLLCYPGLLATIHHRIAHRLFGLGAPLVARIIAEIAHTQTGIDIHPGARIGESFFIDHGTGVVIGETAIIGERVRIYQAVTLGARSFPADEDGSLTKGLERHPIVEDDVVIYSGATILGRVTIGAGAVIGGNVWLTESVPAGRVIHQAFAEQESVDTARLPTGHVNLEAAAI
jgi:serine O-acetyltransferase